MGRVGAGILKRQGFGRRGNYMLVQMMTIKAKCQLYDMLFYFTDRLGKCKSILRVPFDF